jgi:hypothetical protein
MGRLSRMFIPRGARRGVHRARLGLTIVSTITAADNAIASAANRPGGGAGVAVRLPRLAADPDVSPVS